MLKKRLLLIFLIFLFILLFLKVDFRLKPELECCNDDHDYYIHTETFIIDFDFDYSNQLDGFEKRRNFFKGKPSPIGFFGTALFSSPFMFFGNLLDSILNIGSDFGYSNKVLFYSLSSVFYLFMTFFILSKIKDQLSIQFSNFKLLTIYLGTGLPYYAFERFSMTHVYDTFVLTCLIYFLIRFYKSGDSKYIYLVSLFNFLTLITRWTNYQIFLLPFIIKELFYSSSNHKLSRSLNFHLSNIFFLIVFLLHTKFIWGIYTLNPRKIYNQHDFISTYINSLFLNPVTFLLSNINDFFITLFTQEFGVFWFSPIIFFGVLFSVFLFIKNKKLSIILLITYGFYFAIINAWQSTGNAYGFRYVYPLITLSFLLLFFKLKNINKYQKILIGYLLIFSYISILSVLVFEGWLGTQLSLEIVENSFGKYEKFVQPQYLSGFFKGFVEFEVYLKVFTTSFLGMFVFKLLVYVLGINDLNILLNRYGLPADNLDFQNYLIQIDQISFVSILLIAAFLGLISQKIYKYIVGY